MFYHTHLIAPAHEILALFVLCKFILQTRMCSHPVGIDIRFLVGPFVYFHISCVQTAKALARLRGCTGSPEPSLGAYVISTIISCAGSFCGAVVIVFSFLVFLFFLFLFFFFYRVFFSCFSFFPFSFFFFFYLLRMYSCEVLMKGDPRVALGKLTNEFIKPSMISFH